MTHLRSKPLISNVNLHAFSAGFLLSVLNIWNTDRYWRTYVPTVSGDTFGYQGSPLHYATRGLMTNSPLEWFGYLLLLAVLIRSFSTNQTGFLRILFVCTLCFVLGAVVWDMALDFFEVGVLRGEIPM
jgi:hypothetical protein